MKLKKDQTIEGEITRVVEEAVFVDVGAAHDVVIPKVDIDQVKGNPSVTLEVGEIVLVYIYHAPQNGGNPLGSIAHVLGNPYRSPQNTRPFDSGTTFIEEYKVGDIIDGTVTNIKKYGAFVQLPKGVEGLIHVSEMEPGFTSSPWDVVNPGEEVQVRIIQIDPNRKRICLSLKETG